MGILDRARESESTRENAPTLLVEQARAEQGTKLGGGRTLARTLVVAKRESDGAFVLCRESVKGTGDKAVSKLSATARITDHADAAEAGLI